LKNLKNVSRPKPPTKVFQDLKGVKVQDLTVEQYDTLVQDAFLEPENIRYLEDLRKVIDFQEKPRGLQLVQYQGSGAVNSSAYVTLLEVPAGKTFDIQVLTMIQTATADCVISYYLDGILPGFQALLKDVEYTHPSFGVTVDFSTMGDFLISGLSDSPVSLVANRRSGSGAAIHNIFYREVN
tara:strand:- start:445 stop:990 length:546 start_codon:yes stop_codon:yes gene_type:complete